MKANFRVTTTKKYVYGVPQETVLGPLLFKVTGLHSTATTIYYHFHLLYLHGN